MEVLVTLALTSIAITMSYGTLTYIQKLFYNYKKQNKFITEYVDFKKRMDYESQNAQIILEEGKNTFLIKRDRTSNQLIFTENAILFKSTFHCDTFHIKAEKISKEFEMMKNPAWSNKLLNSLKFETEFSKQKFNFYFYKTYDSSVKMALDKTD